MSWSRKFSLTKFKISARMLQQGLNWYPPWIGAGIRITEMQPDFRKARVVMPLTFYNRNFVGTQFGGSLYSMCDPLIMLLLINILGNDFIVWDMAAKIQYKQPGQGQVYADFNIEDTLVDSLRALEPGEKKIFDLPIDVKGVENGEEVLVASVVKTTYVKRKPIKPESKL